MQADIDYKVISINVGHTRLIDWGGKLVSTSIFKQPVDGRVAVKYLNLAGDQQADLTVHGGPDKAVYVYPSEYYDFWRQELPGTELPWGVFGENLTTTGLLDETVNIGDLFRIGSAEVMVTQPRVPCYKLNLKFGRNDMVSRFAKSHYTGFYLAVVKEGDAGAGDSIICLKQDENLVKVADISRLYFEDRANLETMRRALEVPALAEVWKTYFKDQIIKSDKPKN